ncbi:hypothetical protein DFH94DRAFT_786365 [Russula ochroleuca]|uniref:Uncharacterized protein n=1 Tax=Russula ochroleuca TaxID=152965 RepID=A0A9P5JU13_9AGAM|nr:hypothetical protein DFH94DRAFT_786365 [Russula ochroleuca]
MRLPVSNACALPLLLLVLKQHNDAVVLIVFISLSLLRQFEIPLRSRRQRRLFIGFSVSLSDHLSAVLLLSGPSFSSSHRAASSSRTSEV